MTQSPLTPRSSAAYFDWAAIFGGAVIASACAGLFTTFGASLGLATMSAEPGEGSVNMWMIVTVVWLVLTVVGSYVIGGYITGRMRRRVDEANDEEIAARDGLNGLAVWALGTLFTGWMAASALTGAASVAGSAVSAAGQAVGSAVGGAAQGVGAAAGGLVQGVGAAAGGLVQGAGAAVGGVVQGAGMAAGGAGAAVASGEVDGGMMDYITNSLIRPAVTGAQQSADGMSSPSRPSMDNAELTRQTSLVLGNVVRNGEISEEDRKFLIAAVASRSDMSQREVEEKVDAAVKSVQDARAEAAKMAEEAKAEAERMAAEAKAEAERIAAEVKAEAERLKEQAIATAEKARKTAILTAFLMTAVSLIAGAAALMAAIRGGRHRDEGRIWGGLRHRR